MKNGCERQKSAAMAMVPDSNYSELGSVMTAPAWPLQTITEKIASDEESGRGLMLMEVLSKDHGVHRKADGTKVV
jgi:hypothetical protein